MDIYRCTTFPLYHEPIVGPAAKLHCALLIVEWEPSDIYFASALKDARWDVFTTAVMPDDYVRLERVIEALVSAAEKTNKH